MRLSYQWISEYVDIQDLSPQQLAERLTSAGLAVDAVESRNLGVSGVVVGEVQSCVQHPNADKLRVCEVDAGTGDLLTIVCGAANVAAGQKIPTALPGAVLPGGAIGKAKLRGIESHGMLCSAREIGLETRMLPKEQTEGIFVLPPDAPVGADVVALLALDDVVLEVELTPNRADCLSLRGFAYEIGAILDRPVRFPNPVEPDGGTAFNGTPGPVTVRIETERCTRYDAQVMRGLQATSSPLWLQMRLLAMGVRPINHIVDVTNYVMLEWGQPLHAFDLDEVQGGTIVVRQAHADESLVTLDGETRVLNEDSIVIADVHRAIGIAGVMGGQNSEITAGTRQIVLESAAFDAPSTRRTGQRLGLRSEAQQRFEKGIDRAAVRGALVRATQLLTSAGAEPVGDVVSAQTGTAGQHTEVLFSPQRCNRLLGTHIPDEVMADLFRRLGFVVTPGADDAWTITVPSRRGDISMEADLVEEVGRLYGYDNIPSTLPFGATTVGVRNVNQRLRKRTREVLIGAGMTEVFPYSFSHPSALDTLRIGPDSPYRNMIPLLNPLSDERIAMRTHLLPGLAEIAQHNLAHGVVGGEIFEIGRVYWAKELPLVGQPQEPTQWAGLWFGDHAAGLGERARPSDWFDAKGVIETWLHALGLDDVQFQPASFPWLHPGRSAEIVLRGHRIGYLGELHPETAAAYDAGRAIYAEFDVDALVDDLSERWLVHSLPRFPASHRDLAVVVNADVPAGTLLELAQQAGAGILETCHVFDVYTGTGIPAGKKSIAIAFTYRAEDRTLTDDEVAAAQEAILSIWGTAVGAALRNA